MKNPLIIVISRSSRHLHIRAAVYYYFSPFPWGKRRARRGGGGATLSARHNKLPRGLTRLRDRAAYNMQGREKERESRIVQCPVEVKNGRPRDNRRERGKLSALHNVTDLIVSRTKFHLVVVVTAAKRER